MSPEGSLANAFIRLSVSITQCLVLCLFPSALGHPRPWEPSPAFPTRGAQPPCSGTPAERPSATSVLPKGCWGTMTKKMHSLFFPIVWNRQRSHRLLWDGLPMTSRLACTSASAAAPAGSLRWQPVPITLESPDLLFWWAVATKSKAELLLLNPACKGLGFPKEKHGSCHWPSDRFARPRNKPYGSLLHHWKKRQLLPSGKAHTATKQDIWHPHGETCRYKGREPLLSALLSGHWDRLPGAILAALTPQGGLVASPAEESN